MKRTFFQYVRCQRRLIMAYAVMMLFITLLLLVLPGLHIHRWQFVYMHVITLLMLIMYLIIEYQLVSRRLHHVEQRISGSLLINSELGLAKTFEAVAYEDMIRSMNKEHLKTMDQLSVEKRETLQFMTTWFHEIKTPIAVSRLYFEKHRSTPEMISVAEEMDKIEGYVEQALYYMRADAFNYDYLIAQVDLYQLVKDLIVAHKKAFIQKKIRLELDMKPLELPSDKKWLGFVLSQILSNALKYTPEQGHINIYSESDTNEIRLVIADNGIGIDKADQGRIFDQGFTGENGRKFGNSTGMGLYLAQRLSKKLGHRLSIRSKLEKGTAVTVHFPKQDDYFMN